MSPQEREYYRKRAKAERQRAAEANGDVVAEIHTKMASLYETLIELDKAPRRTKLRIVS